MKSLRWRMFAAVAGIILFFVGLSWAGNTFFLEKYYLEKKKDRLISTSRDINARYKGSPADISSYLALLERTSALRIVIYDQNLNRIYDTRENRPQPANAEPGDFSGAVAEPESLLQPEPKPPPLPDRGEIDWGQVLIGPNQAALKKGKVITEMIRDPGLNNSFLNCVSRLNNGDYLILNTPLAAIKESSYIANRFFLFTGLLSLLLGIGAAFMWSEYITRPLRELNQVAREMAKLDFATRCRVRTRDEIGQLGESINSLAEQLDIAINELREKNERLKEDVERERRIDQMRKDFISNISHEMKTPIALIEGYAEGLKVNVVHDEDSKNEYCDVIIDETRKMNRLLHKLLELSKLESGYLELNRAAFDIDAFITQQLAKMQPLLRQKGVNVEWQAEGSGEVWADEFYTEQVFTNYINNALHHVDGKARIRVTARVLGDKVRVEVFNSGRAIPEGELDKIWLPFYKVDKARSRSQGGTGLGLSIVKAIQDLHGNGYGARNTGEGVEFWFDLDRLL